MFTKEIDIGKKAVVEAMRITGKIQKNLTSNDSLTKADKTPVTIADFASQPIIFKILHDNLPHIPIVGEEDSENFKKNENMAVKDSILSYFLQDEKLKNIINADNIFPCIDLGNNDPDKLYWTLDPIDGTKGFLRNDQFSIALALIKNGEVEIGILGCPRLKIKNNPSSKGFLIHARKGSGTYALNLSTLKETKVQVSDYSNPEKIRFVQSYESSHGNLAMQVKIARELKIESDPVQIDSQVKYGIVAMGEAEIYLRIPHPKTPDYKEKIWDHAAGSIIVREAGGLVSDMYGKDLDFCGEKELITNTGILALIPQLQDRVLRIIGKFGHL